jgi:hypothetical protein
MAHVSSLINSTYPYRGTLLRLDANGDGMLSREEIAAGQKPGLLATNASGQSVADSQTVNSNSALSVLIAKLMQLPAEGDPYPDATNSMQPGSMDTGSDDDVDTVAAADLYRSTYGQYALDDMAA